MRSLSTSGDTWYRQGMCDVTNLSMTSSSSLHTSMLQLFPLTVIWVQEML